MRAHLALLAVLAACGDDAGGTTPDARPEDSQQPDTPAGVICTYTEQADATNAASATPEAAGAYSQAVTLCGNVNNGHFDSVEQQIDQDIYKLTFSADTDLIVHFSGAAGSIDELAVQIAQANSRAGYGSWTGDHGALVAHVTAGDWFVTVGAFAATDATGFPYKVTVATDTAGRCAHLTTGGVPEANDGGANNGNDMIEYDAEANPTKRLTTSTADAPEITGVTAAPAGQYRLSGVAANVNLTDDYMDRDTYEFMTGPTTNELSVRLNWPGTASDFDFLVVPKGSVTPIATGLDNALMEDEFETFAVKPNTQYWLWIGEYDASTPTTYDATLCGATYTP